MKKLISTIFIFIFFALSSYALPKTSTETAKKASPAESVKSKKKPKKQNIQNIENANIAEEEYLLGLAYYEGRDVAKDEQKALNFLRKSADKNNDNALLKLARFYKNSSCGLEKDMKKAVELFEKSASLNNKYAIYDLAYLYYQGDYFEKDIDKALDLFLKSAYQGNKNTIYIVRKIYQSDEKNAKALYNLALMCKKFNYEALSIEYFEKALETKYKEEALKEIKELAELGNDKAQYSLAKLYEAGVHINISINKAIKNYELSAKQANKDATTRLKELAKEKYSQAEYAIGYLYHNGIVYAADLNEAIYWYGRAVGQNNLDALSQLEKANDERNADIYATIAFMCKDGDEKSKKKAFNYFKKSASLGNAYSMSNLGMCYEKGVGVKQDHKKAFNLYLKAAKLGNNAAQFNLAKAYRAGRGVEVNFDEAFKYFKLSAEQNNVNAIVDLGICYEKGEGVEVDMLKAIELFKKAMKEDDTYAIFKIAAFYECGEYLKKDPQLALNLFKKAALLGDKTSMEVLEEYRQAAKNGDREVIKLLENLD
ncbi:MAG: tetratricopeptide repeat protein [Opitutales bacterium]